MGSKEENNIGQRRDEIEAKRTVTSKKAVIKLAKDVVMRKKKIYINGKYKRRQKLTEKVKKEVIKGTGSDTEMKD